MKFCLSQNTLQEHKVSVKRKRKEMKALFKSQCNTTKFPVVVRKSGQAVGGLGGICEQGTVGNSL